MVLDCIVTWIWCRNFWHWSTPGVQLKSRRKNWSKVDFDRSCRSALLRSCLVQANYNSAMRIVLVLRVLSYVISLWQYSNWLDILVSRFETFEFGSLTDRTWLFVRIISDSFRATTNRCFVLPALSFSLWQYSSPLRFALETFEPASLF